MTFLHCKERWQHSPLVQLCFQPRSLTPTSAGSVLR
jgi:hypothetical protein